MKYIREKTKLHYRMTKRILSLVDEGDPICGEDPILEGDLILEEDLILEGGHL